MAALPPLMPEPASVAERLTVCEVLRQPVVALVCSPVAVVVGAVESMLTSPVWVLSLLPALSTDQ